MATNETITTDSPKDEYEVNLEPQAPGIAAFDENAPNLVDHFGQTEEGQKLLKKIADKVCRDADVARDGSEEWRRKRADTLKLLVGDVGQKDFPFVGCANVHVPLLLERILRMTNNVISEVFPDDRRICVVEPTGPDDYDTAEILTAHANWQIRNELTDFIPQMHRAVMEFFLSGTVVAHSWYDPVRRRNRHDVLTPDEYLLPYVFTSVEPDMSDMPYKIRLVEKYKGELELLRDSGEWSNVDKVLAQEAPDQSSDDKPSREVGQKHEGIYPGERDPHAPFRFYDYHGTCRLPGQDRDRPICAIVDRTTKQIVKLYIDEEEDWRDRARFDEQQREYEQYVTDMQQFQQVQAKEQELRARLSAPDIMPEEAQSIMAELDSDPVGDPPEPPPWMQNGQGPTPIRKVPVQPFSKGVCIENLNGAMGLSFGMILGEYNVMANEAANRYYDAATLGNCWSLITSGQTDLDKGVIPFGPGKVIRLQGVNDLDKAIKELKPAGANPQLLDMVRMAAEWGDGVTVSGIVSGQPGKSGETFRGVATRAERAVIPLTVAASKFLSFLAQVMRNNARLNALFLPDEDVIAVNDHTRPEGITVGRGMYLRNYKVTFTADVRFLSDAQRIAEADEVLAMINAMPPLQQNSALVYHAVKKALEARHQNDLIPMLGPPPPPPMEPMVTIPPMPPEGMPPGAPGEMIPGEAPPPGDGAPPAMPPGGGGSPTDQPQGPPQ